MRPAVRRVLGGIVVVVMLGMPARLQAQSITESVVKLSPMEAELISHGSAAQGRYPAARHYARSGRELAIRSAVFGTITGLASGIAVSRYCHEEGTSCPRSAFSFFVYGAAIGAVVGFATGR